uniref:Protein RFT1 homolog n=1 Tax=Ascaris lumbricoides TaxID=6252 RepID=A0A9J2PVW5_ASCLU
METMKRRALSGTPVQFPVMMASSTLASSFAPNLSGQLVSRLISFGINMYLLRRISGDLLGVVNVSLTLFYTTTIFLVREPFRKAFLSNDIPLSRVVNHLWLSPLICPLVALSLYSLIWVPFSTVPPLELVHSYEWALFAFGFAAWLEAVAEPFVIVSLRLAMDAQYALAQGLLVVTQRIAVIVLLFFTPMPHITIFCCAQVIPSSREDLSVLGTFALHSAFKQVLTDGTSYVLTFTDRFTLSDKAVFDAVDKLGSLVARVVLAPLEHSAYLFFSANLRRDVPIEKQQQDEVKRAVSTLEGLLHLTVVTGVIVCVFAVPYSPLAVSIYGGDLLSKNSGAAILRFYCVYIVIIAVNGITECFAMATMSSAQLFSHGWFLFIASPLHVLLSFLFSFYIGSYGLILANVVNMCARISYSWTHTRRLFSPYGVSICASLPTPSTVILLLFCLAVSSLSLVVSYTFSFLYLC